MTTLPSPPGCGSKTQQEAVVAEPVQRGPHRLELFLLALDRVEILPQGGQLVLGCGVMAAAGLQLGDLPP
jgi:hypothetical protein